MGDHACAASGRSERAVASVEQRAAGAPTMAIVSLRSQRITVYDADGWILRAPVSSGQKGRETPAGIFSVIEKQAEHYSNLYDDAYMPHMQRITWSGIALHGGPLPGYAASLSSMCSRRRAPSDPCRTRIGRWPRVCKLMTVDKGSLATVTKTMFADQLPGLARLQMVGFPRIKRNGHAGKTYVKVLTNCNPVGRNRVRIEPLTRS
jgi:hypothetical protein